MNGLTATQPGTDALRFPWRWIVAGVVAYLIFLLATFPAARLAARLQTNGILVAGVSGSIWHGHAAAAQANGITLGSTEWQINPWRLSTGTLAADIHAKRDDGYIDANVRVNFGGSVELRRIEASMPISFLSGLHFPNGWPVGWTGAIQTHLDRVTLVNKWPVRIEGEVDILNLTQTQAQSIQYGSHKVKFSPETSNVNTPVGAIESIPGGPLELTGSVVLTSTHTIKIDGFAKPTSIASSAIVDGLKRNLVPDEQGRYPIGSEFSSVMF